MNVVSVRTAYSKVEEYKFELDILRDSLLTPERPLDVLREDVFKTQRAIKPLPSLEERRKELSRLVSEDYQIEYNNELQLRVNEYLIDTDEESDGIYKRIADITVNPNLVGIFSYNNNLEQADLEALYEKYGLDDEDAFDTGLGAVTGIQGSVETNTFLEASEEQIEHLGKTSVDVELEVPNLSEFEDSEDDTNEEVQESINLLDASEPELEQTAINTSKPLLDEGITYSPPTDEDGEFEDSDDEDEENIDDFEDSDDELGDTEDEEGIDDLEDEEEDLEDEEESLEDEEDIDESEDEDSLEDEEDIDESEEDDLEDEEDIDESDEDEDFEDEDLEDEDVEDEDFEDEENIDEIEDDDTIDEPIETSVSQPSKSYTSNAPRDGNNLGNNSTSIDDLFDSDGEVDLGKFDVNLDNSSTDNLSRGATSSSSIEVQTSGIDESDTKDLRQFLRNNPRCDYTDILKYFSKREIDRELSRGRIIKKGKKLKPI